jgi:peptidoglycan/LPS O-acetylase OafA/YrhL
MTTSPRQTRLDKLESIRGFAAVYVVLHHLARQYLPHTAIRLPFIFGPEAVIVFFVLSGFVITYATIVNPSDLLLRNYSVKRVRRIYPIFAFALLLGYLCQAFIVRHWFVPSFKQLAGNLLMCQGISIAPFYDGPLWSLSYEWWFYVLFILLVKVEKAPGRRQFWAAGLSIAGLITAVIYLNQASLFLFYFMIWWCGSELAREYTDAGQVTLKRQLFPVATVALLALGAILLVLPALRNHEPLSAIEYPLLFIRHPASAVVLILAGLAWYKLRFIGFNATLGWFTIFAPISYAIYALHAPILFAIDSVSPGQYGAIKILLTFALVLPLAYVMEVPFQSWINRRTRPLLTAKP